MLVQIAVPVSFSDNGSLFFKQGWFTNGLTFSILVFPDNTTIHMQRLAERTKISGFHATCFPREEDIAVPRPAFSTHRRIAREDTSCIAEVMVFILICIPANNPVA